MIICEYCNKPLKYKKELLLLPYNLKIITENKFNLLEKSKLIPDNVYHKKCYLDIIHNLFKKVKSLPLRPQIKIGYAAGDRIYNPAGFLNAWTFFIIFFGIILIDIFFTNFFMSKPVKNYDTLIILIMLLPLILFSLYIKVRTYLKYERFLQ